MTRQDTAEDVASRFLNNCHQNAGGSQQGFLTAEPFSGAGIWTHQAAYWNKAASPFQATRVPKAAAFVCRMPGISKLFPFFSLNSFFFSPLKLWFKLLRGKMLLRCPSITEQGLGSNGEGRREQWSLSKAAPSPIYCYLTHPRKAEPDISLESQTIYHSNFHYSKKKRSREKGGGKKSKKIKKK